jgi:6-phosphogluconolactonase/glucosamine-6-phosphate isomerase/deaminase
MEIIQVKNLKDCIDHTYELSKDILNNNLDANISVTGGNFGVSFLELLSVKINNMSNKEIYISDERITENKNEKNYNLLIPSLEKLKNNIYSFEGSEIEDFDLQNKEKFNKVFDLSFLSLGEDGHLAGHFENSLDLNEMICYTLNAPKNPPKRISYKVSWLLKSKLTIISAIGDHKREALINLLKGKGIHSKAINSSQEKILLLTDQNIDFYS